MKDQVVFAWHGFQFNHPKDWAPLSFSGDRAQGYVRISSLEKGFLQFKWNRSAGEILDRGIDKYLARIAADAARTHSRFSKNSSRDGNRIRYSYRANISGRGVCFPLTGTTGHGILEAVDCPASIFNQAESSFLIQDGPLERWSLHGLDIWLPTGLKLDSHELKAGKTTLQLSGSKMRAVAERWGFAEMLLAKKSLADWVRSVSSLRNAESEEFSDRIELVQQKKFLPNVWIRAILQEEFNQITIIRVESRKPEFQPQWNWFASLNNELPDNPNLTPSRSEG